MKWQGGEESGNLEDRRRFGSKRAAVGGGAILILIVGALLGVDPDLLNQFVGDQQAPVAQQREQQQPPTQQDDLTRKFSATILRFTEKVWDEEFQQSGEHYQAPHMVLFSDRTESGCGVAPSSVGPFYCPADRTVY